MNAAKRGEEKYFQFWKKYQSSFTEPCKLPDILMKR